MALRKGTDISVRLVGQADNSVTLRATVRVRVKARFAGNGWPPWQETQHRVALAQRLPKGHGTSIVGCVAVLEKGMPFPADCALPTMLVPWLSVTELSAWPTRSIEWSQLAELAS